jgi:hypothetical protein
MIPYPSCQDQVWHGHNFCSSQITCRTPSDRNIARNAHNDCYTSEYINIHGLILKATTPGQRETVTKGQRHKSVRLEFKGNPVASIHALFIVFNIVHTHKVYPVHHVQSGTCGRIVLHVLINQRRRLGSERPESEFAKSTAGNDKSPPLLDATILSSYTRSVTHFSSLPGRTTTTLGPDPFYIFKFSTTSPGM